MKMRGKKEGGPERVAYGKATFNLEWRQIEAMRKLRQRTGKSISWQAREAIDDYLEKERQL